MLDCKKENGGKSLYLSRDKKKKAFSLESSVLHREVVLDVLWLFLTFHEASSVHT